MRKKLLIAFATLIIALVTACGIYLYTYYEADEGAVAVFLPSEEIAVTAIDAGHVVFEPRDATVGFIFYPGGKVDFNAYQPLLAALAREGILTVLIKMPFNLAVFDIDAADGIKENYPQIEKWYIGGHSLGGSMAASYLSENASDFKGLILLAAYSTADLSETKLDVLSIFGEKDLVLNRKKYAKSKDNLPTNFKELIIEGGNHAGFGLYGNQKGDGTALISPNEQIFLTVSAITKFVK